MLPTAIAALTWPVTIQVRTTVVIDAATRQLKDLAIERIGFACCFILHVTFTPQCFQSAAVFGILSAT